MQTNRGYGENKHLAGSSSASSASSAASGGTRTISSSSGSSSSSNGSGSSFLRAGGTIRSSPGSAAAMSSPSAAVSTAAASHRMQSTIATTATASIVPTSQSSTTTFAQNALRMKSNLQALYSGVSAPLMTVGLVQSINFAVYDSTRRYLFSSGNNNSSSTSQNYRSSDPIRNVAIAGFVSGTATAVVTAPLILIKTHQQITGSSFQQALQSLSMMKGCMRAGFLPHLVCETFGRSVYYATYETMKRTFSSRMNNASSTSNTTTGQSHDAVSLGQRMVCAASSGIICWSLIFPLDSLRSRVYSEFVVGNNNTTASGAIRASSSTTRSNRSSSSLLVQMIRKMYNEQSFYRGFRVTVLRAGPVAAVVLPVYDLVLDTLSSSSSSR